MISVQNLSEYTAMMVMLGLYTLAVAMDLPVIAIGVGFGGLFAVVILLLWLGLKKHAKN